MKRYRVLNMSFDSRAVILNTVIGEEWEDDVKNLWRGNKQQITEGLIHEFGVYQYEKKVANFVEFGQLPFSVIAYHTKFLSQIRNAYVIGAYYPSLTATCTLGERILNHLILQLRDHFKGSKYYRHVYRKNSFDNYGFCNKCS